MFNRLTFKHGITTAAILEWLELFFSVAFVLSAINAAIYSDEWPAFIERTSQNSLIYFCLIQTGFAMAVAITYCIKINNLKKDFYLPSQKSPDTPPTPPNQPQSGDTFPKQVDSRPKSWFRNKQNTFYFSNEDKERTADDMLKAIEEQCENNQFTHKDLSEMRSEFQKKDLKKISAKIRALQQRLWERPLTSAGYWSDKSIRPELVSLTLSEVRKKCSSPIRGERLKTA